MSNRKELKRMIEETDDIAERLAKLLNEFGSLHAFNGNKEWVEESIFHDEYYPEDDEDYRVFKDDELLLALDRIARLFCVFRKIYGNPAHRREDEGMNEFLNGADLYFHEKFSKPLIPVISLFAQVVSDTRQTLSPKRKPGPK